MKCPITSNKDNAPKLVEELWEKLCSNGIYGLSQKIFMII